MSFPKLVWFRSIASLVAAGFIVTLLAAPAPAAVSAKLTPSIGPPTTPVVVAGSGFPDSTAVDIYFDTTDVALAVTSATGVFSGISIQVPAAAVPGTHWISAVSRGTSGTAAQAAFTVQTNYSQFHYSALHRGRNPYENVLTSSTVGAIDLDWSFTTGGVLTSSPAVNGGIVYFGSADDYLYAINATTGALVWKFKTGNSIVDSSPAVAGGNVYIGSTDDSVYAVNATTGAQVWKFTTGAAVNSSPAVVNGVVYIGSGDDSVYAINATTGVQVWKFTTAGAVLSSPAVANGVVYVGSYDDNIYAINATTGTQFWKYTTGGKVFSSPAVADDVVFVGSDDANMYAVNARTGILVWKFAGTAGTEFESSPAVYDGDVYVGSDAGYFYALSAQSGSVIWSALNSTPVEIGSPCIANGIEYVGFGGNVHAYFQLVTASILWNADTGGTVTATPTVANGVVYVASQDGILYAFDLNGSTQVVAPPSRPDPALLLRDLSLQPFESK